MTTYAADPIDQSVVAGETDDVLNGGKGDDVFDGGAGDDILNGGAGADTLLGGEGDDQLHGGAGTDILEGGIGDDRLVGGSGADSYVINFNFVAGGSITTYQNFYFTPNAGTDSKLQQGELSSQYNNFLVGSIPDLDGDGQVEYSWNPNITNGQLSVSITEGADANTSDGTSTVSTSSATTVSIYRNNGAPAADPSDNYDGVVTIATTVQAPPTLTSGDGHDTIYGFKLGEDQLNFGSSVNSFDQATFESFFEVEEIDTDGDAVNDATVLSIEGDDSFSITFAGLTGATESDFWNALG